MSLMVDSRLLKLRSYTLMQVVTLRKESDRMRHKPVSAMDRLPKDKQNHNVNRGYRTQKARNILFQEKLDNQF